MPSQPDQSLVDRVIFEEMRARYEDASRKGYVRIMRGLAARGADGIVLGCTEIGLLIRPVDLPDVAVYDTTELHVAGLWNWHSVSSSHPARYGPDVCSIAGHRLLNRACDASGRH